MDIVVKNGEKILKTFYLTELQAEALRVVGDAVLYDKIEAILNMIVAKAKLSYIEGKSESEILQALKEDLSP